MRMGSTDTGPRSLPLVAAFEADFRGADEDVILRCQPGPFDALPVHGQAVRRAEVDDPVGAVLASDLRVPARDVRVVDHDVAGARAADDDGPVSEFAAGTAAP